MPMDRALAKQLERRGIVRITEHVYERWAWGKVETRLPVVTLAVSRAEAVALVQQDVS